VFRVLATRRLSEPVFEMTVEAPAVAAKARAGQFLIVRVDETGERIPLTFSDWSADEGWVRFVYLRVGKTTHKLSHLGAGDDLSDLVGPLGKPSHVGGLGRVAVIGGGVGAAVAHPVARAMVAAGDEVTVVLGARTRDLLVLEEEIRGLPLSDVIVCTDDGSAGRRDLVTAPLKELCEARAIDHVFAVGPAVMMRWCAATTKPFGVATTVSLNPIMVDGTGMCGACRVSVGARTLFGCIDGPDFDGHLVDFEELMSRQRVYDDAEREAAADYERECACRTK
jgi:ferredoxin--NADP+ reductase